MEDQDKLNKIIKKRNQIVYDYCISKGWPLLPENLSIEQIMEIRKLKEWKEASLD
ncbi:MAG: hypothetical protein V4549_06545 [Bacteroidota bacterium]